jgi:hypothetical protein
VKRLAAAALFALTGAAEADVVSEKPDSVVVAVYHEGTVDTRQLMEGTGGWDAFGFIVETRTVDLPAGPSVVRFRDVASTIVPESIHIDGLPGQTERDFDYDLLSPGTLLAHSVGREVHLVRTDTKTGKETDQTAIVRSAADGAVLDIGGKIEALDCSGTHERLVFDDVPEGLIDKPTLSVRAIAPAAGRYTIRLSYIAMKMNWSADYVARVEGETLSLTGWITLANFSDTGFRDTPAEVIGGSPHTTGSDHEVAPQVGARTHQCWPLDVDWIERPISSPLAVVSQQEMVETVVVAASRRPEKLSSSPLTADVRDFGDYKLYTMPVRTDVAAKQTKQVAFLDQHQVKFEKVYAFTVPVYWPNGEDMEVQPVTVRYRVQNKEADGLGKPMPGGTVSVIDTDERGAPVFVGQASIDDTPVGLPVTVNTGEAFDVQVKPRLVATETTGTGRNKRSHITIEVAITNGKPAPVRFELSQELEGGEIRIPKEDFPHVLEEGVARWKLTLAPGEHTIMHYELDGPDD